MLENHDSPINGEKDASKSLRNEEMKKEKILPQEAIENGFKDDETWEKAKSTGFKRFEGNKFPQVNYLKPGVRDHRIIHISTM